LLYLDVNPRKLRRFS